MGKKISILHVGLSDNVGGIETVVRSWHKLLPDDITFDFVNTSVGKLAFEEEFVKKGAKVYKIPSRKDNAKGSYNALKKIIAEGNYDYLHFHAMSLSWIEPVLIAGKSNRTQGIIHSHMVVDNNMSMKYRILHLIGRARLHMTSYYELACGKEAGRSMFGNEKYAIIPNGIELDRFSFSKEKRHDIRNGLGINEDEWVIGHVGRPGPQKNYPLIFQTIHELIKEENRRSIKLLLIGNIENNDEIKNLVERYNIKEHLIFTGHVTDTSAYYSAMDCFYFPSLYEGFSVSLIEAQATGLPCVASINVASEAKLTNNLSFVSINDTRESKIELRKYMDAAINREEHVINLSYNIRETSKKVFEFYRDNL